MTSKEAVKLYCEKFGLSFVETPNSPLDDQDEWADTICAGFDGDPAFGAVVIYLTIHDTIRVVTKFANGTDRMDDRLERVTALQLEGSVLTGAPWHPHTV